MKLDTRLSGYLPSAVIIAVFLFIDGFFILENEPGTVLLKSLIVAAVWMIVLFLLSRRRGRKAARVYNELRKKHTTLSGISGYGWKRCMDVLD